MAKPNTELLDLDGTDFTQEEAAKIANRHVLDELNGECDFECFIPLCQSKLAKAARIPVTPLERMKHLAYHLDRGETKHIRKNWFNAMVNLRPLHIVWCVRRLTVSFPKQWRKHLPKEEDFWTKVKWEPLFRRIETALDKQDISKKLYDRQNARRSDVKEWYPKDDNDSSSDSS